MSEGDYQQANEDTPLQSSQGTDFLLERPHTSTNVLHVYTYDLELNRFKPYKMAKVKRSDNFPQEQFNCMLDDFGDQGRPPRIDRITHALAICLVLTIIFCFVVYILEHLGHSKALTVLLWMIALVPCGITSLMCMVFCVAYMTVLGRRNSLNLLAELRNRQVFNPMGINIVFSQNFEWFCVEIRNKNIAKDDVSEIKIGKKDDKDKEGVMDQIDDDFDF
jgi:hypothetical protein